MLIRRSVLKCGLTFAVTLTVLTACGSEGPTDIGGGLLPARQVCTFDQVLPASVFLESDTVLPSVMRAADADYLLVALDYDGELNARALSRLGELPAAISYTDADGDMQIDTMPEYIGGRVVLLVDSAKPMASQQVRLGLWHAGEHLDPATANWTFSVDSGTVQRVWDEPGGTLGDLIDEAVWSPGQDSVAFTVDAATIVNWSDTSNIHRDVVITALDPDTRIRATRILLRGQVQPAGLPESDTLVYTATTARSTFIYSPQLPRTAALQVGGTPAWRSVLRFKEGLDTLQLADPQDRPGCSAILGEATINRATLVLEPAGVPQNFVIEDSLYLGARVLRESVLYPLNRAPLGEWVGRLDDPLAPELFQEGMADPGTASLAITEFVASLVASQGNGNESPTKDLLTLLAGNEGSTFGFAAFSGMAGASPPLLRLTVTVAGEVRF